MNIYDEFEKVEIYKGREIRTIEKELVAYRCDFSGKLIEIDDVTANLYSCNYMNKDEGFGLGYGERELITKYQIDIHHFLSQDYIFYSNDYEDLNVENNMIEAIRLNKQFNFLESYLRCYRVKAAKKLLEDGVVKPENLYI